MHHQRSPARGVHRAAIAALFVLLVLPATTWAHAELVSSSPGAGTTVTGPIDQVVLVFDEEVRENSHFEVRVPGQVVARGKPDPEQLDQMVANAASLGPGTYTVAWTSIGQDRELARGSFTFTIATATPSPATPTPATTPTGPSPSTPPSATPSATATATQVPVPTASADPGPGAASSGDIAVPILATLVVIGGLGLWLVRRQRRA